MPKNKKLEDELRKEIIECLEKIEGIEVYDMCSSVEFGIDLTFERKDTFGIARLYGIQLKTGNLSSRRNKISRSLKEIIGQIAIAFGHRFQPQDKRLDAIYVVVDGDISTHALHYIRSASVGFREVYFIDKQKLNKFFAENKPKVASFKET